MELRETNTSTCVQAHVVGIHGGIAYILGNVKDHKKSCC